MATSVYFGIDLLLVGKTGNGKSATGNSILCKPVFFSGSSTTSVTTDVKTETAVIQDRLISVTDTPGLGDTRFDKKTGLDVANQALKKTFEGYSFNAVLIVLRFGCRFTDEDWEMVQMAKAILGQDVVEKFGIIVITCGDNFQHAMDEDDSIISFENWCCSQTHRVKSLFEECNYRCVLFDNRTKDSEKINSQREKLLTEVMSLNNGSLERFGMKEFKIAKQQRKLTGICEGFPQLQLDVHQVIVNVRSEYHQLKHDRKRYSFKDYNDEIATLFTKLEIQKEYLEEVDKGTGLLEELIDSVVIEQSELYNGDDSKRRGLSENDTSRTGKTK